MPPEMRTKKPQLPEREWSVTKEEKEKIVALGRELSKFILDYANKNGNGRFHTKLVAGAFQYWMELTNAKARAAGDDLLIVENTVKEYNLGKGIDEPFVEDEEPVETVAQKRERLSRELEGLPKEGEDAPQVNVSETAGDPDVDAASIAPSSVPLGMREKKEE